MDFIEKKKHFLKENFIYQIITEGHNVNILIKGKIEISMDHVICVICSRAFKDIYGQ